MSGENRSEKATPHRRQKAREQGQVAVSSELGSAIGISAAIWSLSSCFLSGIVVWRSTWFWALSSAGDERLRPLTGVLLSGRVALYWLLPALGASFTLAALCSVSQSGGVFSPSLLQPKLERISPAKKLKQIFSSASAMALAKSLLPAVAIVYLLFSVFTRDWNLILRTSGFHPQVLASTVGSRIVEICWKSTLVLFVWAVIDALAKRRKFEAELRMTPQEVREEVKESEGNPQIKARIRKLQRQVRRKRMLEDVAKSAVVITNPTEYAIALEYHEKLVAPVVVAKGRSLLAQQIKQTALWNQIPTVENVPLAHALYRTADVGQAIPAKLYAAVAEILAFVFRAQARVRPGGIR